MNRNVVVGIVVVLALAVVGWWYWAMMMPAQDAVIEEPAAGDVSSASGSIELSAMDLAGTWRSKEDARFVRVFTTDGNVTDRYEGDDSATVTGTWNVVEDPASERPELVVNEGMQVIRVQFAEEVMYFAIADLTETDLSMIYLSGNGTLEFSRVQ